MRTDEVMRVSARGIILRDQNVLLAEVCGGRYYNLPGGGVQEGENFHEALIRELREEAGIDIRVGRLLFALDYEPGRNECWAGRQRSMSLVFQAFVEPDQEPCCPEDTHDAHMTGVRWVSVEELASLVLVPPIRADLVQYIETGVYPIAYYGDAPPVDIRRKLAVLRPDRTFVQ